MTSNGLLAWSPGTRRAAILGAALVAMLMVLVLSAGAARAATPQALILGDTVSAGTAPDGSGNSIEEYEAQQDGFQVTVVDGATWDSMTAAQFAAYQVLIIGDPTCGFDNFEAAVSNETTWEPVVMGSGGNKVIIGTDPTYHYLFSGKPGNVLEGNGIAYAGALAGATGAYIDLSCTYTSSGDDTPVPLLDGLSTHGAGQFTVGGAPCAGSISIIAATGPTTGLTDDDLSNWECSVHEFFDHFPGDYTPLALATDPSVPVTYTGTDVDTGAAVSGSPYILISGGGITIQSNLVLAPPTQTLPAGTAGTVTATLTNTTTSSPISGAEVDFDVTSGPDAGQTFSGTTNGSGQVSFTDTNSGTTGTDQLLATATVDGVTSQGTASITWTASATDTSLTTSLSGGGQSGATISVPAGTAVTDSSTLTGTNAASATGSVTYNVYSDSGCTDLVSGPDAESITTAGTMPDSQAVTLNTPGTYYWQAVYSGDSANTGSASTCGSEVETVTAIASPEPTSTFTALSGDGSTAPQIAVAPGSSVSDQATLSGANTASAGGTVTYNVYSDATCMTPAAAPMTVSVTAGSVPASPSVTLAQGTYWWTASYSGDALNNPSTEGCGLETEVVLSSATSGADVGVQVVTEPGTTVSTSGESVICVTVTNYGPDTAKNVVTAILLPSTLNVDNAGGGLKLGRLVGWFSGTMSAGATITYHVWVNPTASSGNATIVAGGLSLGTHDPNYKNNLAAEKLTYAGPMSHLKGRSVHANSPLLARLRALGNELKVRLAHQRAAHLT